ncbi:hypothetical protein IHE45_01G028000 [Dioscorea alata]|uniref:Uncharacterized protein n=1 Tax=Dioscorea alata TaxID=55571 RepID=A0ACB7WTR2_DIOAL|nr:hypothetical protein IHE45_01G028000 [Dioscorea alata]
MPQSSLLISSTSLNIALKLVALFLFSLDHLRFLYFVGAGVFTISKKTRNKLEFIGA